MVVNFLKKKKKKNNKKWWHEFFFYFFFFGVMERAWGYFHWYFYFEWRFFLFLSTIEWVNSIGYSFFFSFFRCEVIENVQSKLIIWFEWGMNGWWLAYDFLAFVVSWVEYLLWKVIWGIFECFEKLKSLNIEFSINFLIFNFYCSQIGVIAIIAWKLNFL